MVLYWQQKIMQARNFCFGIFLNIRQNLCSFITNVFYNSKWNSNAFTFALYDVLKALQKLHENVHTILMLHRANQFYFHTSFWYIKEIIVTCRLTKSNFWYNMNVPIFSRWCDYQIGLMRYLKRSKEFH